MAAASASMQRPTLSDHLSTMSLDSTSTQHFSDERQPRNRHITRPGLGSRKSSGSIIVSRDSPNVEMHDEQYDADDARAMSPRRSSDEIEKMGDDARHALEEQARILQEGLNEIMTRVESVKSEHEKLEGGNRFLQSYIGELMQTSKIATTAPKAKSKGRGK